MKVLESNMLVSWGDESEMRPDTPLVSETTNSPAWVLISACILVKAVIAFFEKNLF